MRLVTQATAGVTRIAEGVHQSVWSTLGFRGAAPGRTRGLTGLVYRSVYAVTGWLGGGADAALADIEARLGTADDDRGGPRRHAALAVLNGVMGDRLAADDNSLATPMSLHVREGPLDAENVLSALQGTGRIAVLIHGLCMDEAAWHVPDGSGHGDALAAFGYTPVYLRYNSGRHTSENGRELARMLERLVDRWPVPVDSLSVLAHSMGGLVARSAVHYARRDGARWPGRLRQIVFLGTPHHGAPLERAGSWVDTILGSTSYTAPFAALGQLRSAGITDLRYGYVLDRDWQDRDRFVRAADARVPLALPEGIACYAVAAARGTASNRLLDGGGDGLVPVRSALGLHEDANRSLAFSEKARWVAYETDHFALLRSPDVVRQVGAWMTGDGLLDG